MIVRMIGIKYINSTVPDSFICVGDILVFPYPIVFINKGS